MVPGVISNQVTIAPHLLKDIFIPFNVFPNQKKRCMNFSFSQTIQEKGRILGIWPVIEGKGDSWSFF